MFVGDPLVIYSEKKTAIANIKAIKLGNQNKKFINVDDFQSKNLFFDVHPLDLTEHDYLYWNGSFVGEMQNVSSGNAIVIKPRVNPNPPEGMTNFSYDKQLLFDIGVQLAMCTSSTSNSVKEAKNKCEVCNKAIAPVQIRGHVGYHILALGVDSNVCGFCGLSSCSNNLTFSCRKDKNNYYKIVSNCTYFFA